MKHLADAQTSRYLGAAVMHTAVIDDQTLKFQFPMSRGNTVADFDMASQRLHTKQALSARLQTTLQIDQQIAMLWDLVNTLDLACGIRYQHLGAELNLHFGNKGKLKTFFHPTLDKEGLGKISFTHDQAPSAEQRQLLGELIDAMLHPLHNALLYLTAMRLAMQDPLTGVQNRLAMGHALEREVNLARRQGTDLTLLVVDVDLFKRINDQYGHAFGDAVLKSIAENIKQTVRNTDLVFRFGGEEFVVISSHTEDAGAQQLAERVCHAIRNINEVEQQPMQLSVSIGVAQLNPQDDGPSSLFERADAAMYQAKNSGRDCVKTH